MYPNKKNTKKKNEDICFGIRPVAEAINAGKNIDKVLIQYTPHSPNLQELLAFIKEKGISYQKVPAAKLNRITRKQHQGVIAFLAAVPFASLAPVIQSTYENGKTPFVLLLDKITDVRNFGGIVRSALCAGVDTVVIPEKGAAQLGGDAMKTSAGALTHLPIVREQDFTQAIAYLKESGLQIVACHEKTTQSIHEVEFTAPTAIIMGAEDTGISPELLPLVDHQVKIPMAGPVASLNVSAAAAVMLYEVVRQRNE